MPQTLEIVEDSMTSSEAASWNVMGDKSGRGVSRGWGKAGTMGGVSSELHLR